MRRRLLHGILLSGVFALACGETDSDQAGGGGGKASGGGGAAATGGMSASGGTSASAGVGTGGSGGTAASGAGGIAGSAAGGAAGTGGSAGVVTGGTGGAGGGADCDLDKVQCKKAMPICAKGHVPTHDGAGCFGPCVSFASCKSVSGCAACPSTTYCVHYESLPGQTVHEYRCLAKGVVTCSGLSCSCFGQFCQSYYPKCLSVSTSVVECHE